MNARWVGGAWLVVWAATLTGCVDERTGAGTPGASCEPPCSPSSGSGSGGTGGEGGDGGAGGSAPLGDVSGSAVVLTDASFEVALEYSGPIDVTALSLELDALGDADVSAGAPTTFTLRGLPEGTFWMHTADASAGAAGVLSTYTLQAAPSSAVQAPVVDLAMLSAIGQTLLPTQAVDPTRAHVFVSLRRGGVPLTGVTVANLGAPGTVTYDLGPDGYVTSPEVTGAYGRILALNLDVATPHVASLELVDSLGTPFSLPLPLGPGSVTVVGFDL